MLTIVMNIYGITTDKSITGLEILCAGKKKNGIYM